MVAGLGHVRGEIADWDENAFVDFADKVWKHSACHKVWILEQKLQVPAFQGNPVRNVLEFSDFAQAFENANELINLSPLLSSHALQCRRDWRNKLGNLWTPRYWL